MVAERVNEASSKSGVDIEQKNRAERGDRWSAPEKESKKKGVRYRENDGRGEMGIDCEW